jgi:hypothetical protein
MRVFRFETEFKQHLDYDQTLPIFDAYGTLVGGFTRLSDTRIVGFVSGTGYPLALEVSTEGFFYFTAHTQNEVIAGAILTNCNTGTSIKVTCAHEETT